MELILWSICSCWWTSNRVFPSDFELLSSHCVESIPLNKCRSVSSESNKGNLCWSALSPKGRHGLWMLGSGLRSVTIATPLTEVWELSFLSMMIVWDIILLLLPSFLSTCFLFCSALVAILFFFFVKCLLKRLKRFSLSCVRPRNVKLLLLIISACLVECCSYVTEHVVLTSIYDLN